MSERILPHQNLPLQGADNPSTHGEGTNPGSFARRSDVGGPYMFSSPDTPGMPVPSDRTAWDFMPEGFRLDANLARPPEGFSAVTQLEHARLGTVTKEMQRVAEREPHLKPEMILGEIAAG